MGPALAGNQASRHSAPRVTESRFAVPTSATTNAALGENLTRTAAPTLQKSKGKEKTKVKEEEEEYSDPDEGVEIIDMNRIRDMDWMAPEALREEKKREKVKEERGSDVVGESSFIGLFPTSMVAYTCLSFADLKNAIDLSESEEEEKIEDLIEDFTVKNDMEDIVRLPSILHD